MTLVGIANERDLVTSLIARAVTPAHLIPEMKQAPQGHGGALLEKSQMSRPSCKKQDIYQDTDLADVVIADFNEGHIWEEIAALCGGLRNNRFCAVWRGEKHASVVIDPNGLYACDHGRIGTTYLKKLDKYEVWCLAQGIDKTRDLAERIAAYRKARRAKDEKSLNNPPVKHAVSQEYQPPPASDLAKKMVNYEVMYLPNVPCSCGCELWRPVLGDFECCRCSPHPLWPDKYDQAMRELYPQNGIS